MTSRPPVLHTSRLRLVPCAASVARSAEAGGADAVEQLLGVNVHPSWPSADLREILLGYADAVEADPSMLGWGLWLVLDGRGRNLVGDVGFKGPPDDHGSIEIGYGIVPPYRGKGLATEAVRGLLAWAWAQPGVRRILARCYAVNEASKRVLAKVGFEQQGGEAGILDWALEAPAAE
ncbi:MAG TPA: GNAT family N-acetyltransferase [Vulgatibacter sp.]|nr:GNAT family N-acetyltransferase [Vulgatibacter sp.]